MSTESKKMKMMKMMKMKMMMMEMQTGASNAVINNHVQQSNQSLGNLTFQINLIGLIGCSQEQKAPIYNAINAIDARNQQLDILLQSKDRAGAYALSQQNASTANGLGALITSTLQSNCPGQATGDGYNNALALANNVKTQMNDIITLYGSNTGIAVQAYKKEDFGVFEPTPKNIVKDMLDMVKLKPNEVLFDIGCGDGRIVVEAAKRKAKAIGIDSNHLRIDQTIKNAKKAGVTVETKFAHANEVDYSSANVITMFLLPEGMDKLLPKFKKGTRIISHHFKFTNWKKPKQTKFFEDNRGKRHKIHLWIV